MPDVKLTWLGHSTILLKSPNGKKILVDPWLSGNPSCPEDWKSLDKFKDIDLLLITHGHFDHVGEAIELCKKHKPPVCCMVELGAWLEQKGVENISPMNKGGTQAFGDIKITMTNANHSAGIIEDDGTIVYAGEPNGFVIHFENQTNVYVAGDTNVFGDMALIRELYKPGVAVLPIGDHFTMGPLEAAKATELLGVKKVVPVHYATFPLLTGSPDALQERVNKLGAQVIAPGAGETIEL